MESLVAEDCRPGKGGGEKQEGDRQGEGRWEEGPVIVPR